MIRLEKAGRKNAMRYILWFPDQARTKADLIHTYKAPMSGLKTTEPSRKKAADRFPYDCSQHTDSCFLVRKRSKSAHEKVTFNTPPEGVADTAA